MKREKKVGYGDEYSVVVVVMVEGYTDSNTGWVKASNIYNKTRQDIQEISIYQERDIHPTSQTSTASLTNSLEYSCS